MPKSAASAPVHRWNFYRAGGVDQVRIDTGADILHLDQLDQKLWVALSCPVKGLEFDERTLQLLDVDDDAHVRPPEILAAVAWLKRVLKNLDELVKGQDGVPLSSIRTDTEEGQRLLASAKHVLAGLGKGDAGVITVADTMQTAELFLKARHNGDGVVPAEVVADGAARKVAQELLAGLGGAPDRSGKAGFDQARIEAFFAECQAFSNWHAAAERDAKNVLPLGDGSAAAAAALEAVRAKVDDYFGRCRLAGFDPRATAAVNREERAYLEVAAKDMSITAAEVAHFPLSMVAAGQPLALDRGLNPAWSGAVQRFRELCVAPLLGKDKNSLSEGEWENLCGRFAAHRAWAAAKAGAKVEGLGLARVREILAGGSRAALEAEVAADLAVAPQVDAITQVEKLARLYHGLHTLLNNYVSFSDFYARRKAVFQAGTLYLDERACDLCIQVRDPAKHGTLAAMAKTYLAYVDCTRPGEAKMTLACAFTAGDSDNLFVGRNGLFYDRRGRDWDATISKIVDNPISIGQSFWSPYKKLLRWIEEQVAKRASDADQASTAKLQTAATSAGAALQTGAVTQPAPAAAPKKMDIGVLAAISVAISGVTAIVGTVLAQFFGLGYLMPLGIVGLILLISGPSMLIAWLKLRQRNLGPILDANGWAVNTLTKVNIPLGRSLTAVAALPPGAKRSLVDPYAPKKKLWPRVLLAGMLLGGAGYGLWRFGLLHKWWPGCPLPQPAAASDAAEEGAGAEPAPPPAGTAQQ